MGNFLINSCLNVSFLLKSNTSKLHTDDHSWLLDLVQNYSQVVRQVVLHLNTASLQS